MIRRPCPPRRGLAMLLVLISLAFASIIATAYLASRDNSAAIGENVVASAAARWASQAAADLGVAVLQTEINWREAHVDGVILDDYVIGDAVVDVTLLDLETSAPPTIDTRHVQVTGVATVNGIEQVSSIRASFDGDGDDDIDVDLSEFAIFASNDIDLGGDATIGRWETAPSSALGERIAIGTNELNGGSVKLTGGAAGIDVSVYHGPGASAGLVVNPTGPAVELVELPEAVPMPPGPTPPGLPAVGGRPTVDRKAPLTISVDARVDSLSMLTASGVLTVSGDRTVIVEDALTLDAQALMLVDGDVTLVVMGPLTLGPETAIELTAGARLTAYVGGAVTLNDAYIGPQRPDATRDHTGGAAYMDPDRVRIFGFAAGSVPWQLGANSVVLGSLYAPTASVVIADMSALYGYVAAESVQLDDSAAVFYDHALDLGEGYTNLSSLVYDAGVLRNEVATITSLDASTVGSLETTIKGMAGAATPPEAVAGEPTPRPVQVECEYLCFGTDMAEFEALVAGY